MGRKKKMVAITFTDDEMASLGFLSQELELNRNELISSMMTWCMNDSDFLYEMIKQKLSTKTEEELKRIWKETRRKYYFSMRLNEVAKIKLNDYVNKPLDIESLIQTISDDLWRKTLCFETRNLTDPRHNISQLKTDIINHQQDKERIKTNIRIAKTKWVEECV